MRSLYHFLLALGGALYYRFPSRQIYVVGITGTKGKTSTAELVSAVLEAAGHKTAICSTLRFKIAGESEDNRKKMTMPGRAFIQKFLRQAVAAGCDYAIVEMTSQGVLQHRHRFIALDALIFTNLSPEHIESHGSYENYVQAKLKIARALERSPKPNKIIIANGDDQEAPKFLAVNVPQKISYQLAGAPTYIKESSLPGEFNRYNLLAAAAFARSQKISEQIIEAALSKVSTIRGRMEKVGGKDFDVIVDYAHTPDSLEKVYRAFESRRKICVLGGTGGGRDQWKRPVMGEIAARYCNQIFLTDEDPYNEDPLSIVEMVAKSIPPDKYKIIMDRREAIKKAIEAAKPSDVVIITGKGTDPYIMRAKGAKEPWSDARVAKEELAKLGK
jgi:UDP-N-acetylmuramoyl-L-alanyl-D-glutamate--2,6-diaminopimelate ligase